jgi:hypothetical protein
MPKKYSFGSESDPNPKNWEVCFGIGCGGKHFFAQILNFGIWDLGQIFCAAVGKLLYTFSSSVQIRLLCIRVKNLDPYMLESWHVSKTHILCIHARDLRMYRTSIGGPRGQLSVVQRPARRL